MPSCNILDDFVERQRAVWPMADKNFSVLENAQTKELPLGDFTVKVQFNPDRVISTDARTDRKSLQQRPCFLCPEHRFPEQIYLPLITAEGNSYDILLNPFPIFPRHLVVALSVHKDQGIKERLKDLLFMTAFFPQYTFYYNGPVSGASAPDHHHFQGIPERLMPLENIVRARQGEFELLAAIPSENGNGAQFGGGQQGEGNGAQFGGGQQGEGNDAQVSARLYHHKGFCRGVYVIEAESENGADELFQKLLEALPTPEGESEPRINVVAYCEDVPTPRQKYVVLVVCRKSHRSHHYFSKEEDHLAMSPGCADMAGYFITPYEEDFRKLDAALLDEMVSEITASPELEAAVCEALKQR